MIARALFKVDMKNSIKLMFIFWVILVMYSIVIIWMFDPEFSEMLLQYQQMMPELMSAFGMEGETNSLIAFMNTYLYGFLMLIIPMIFELMLVNQCVMKYVDNGSIACILATPNSRKKIIITQMLAILISIVILISATAMAGYLSAEILFQGELDVAKYINLNISTLLLHFTISGISFFSACFFNEEKNYLAIGAGLPLAFYLIQMLSGMGDSLDKLKYFTIYTLFPADYIISGEGNVLFYNLMMLFLAALLYSLGAIRFIKKDMPI